MNFLWAFRNETDTHVWIIIIKNIQLMLKSLINTRICDQFKRFVQHFLKNITLKVGFEEKTNDSKFKVFAFVLVKKCKSFSLFILHLKPI